MKTLPILLILSLLAVGTAQAADPVAAYAKGARTINLEGNIDFEQNDELTVDLSVGLGYFPLNRVMLKGYLDFADYGDSDAAGLGVGAYYYQPVGGPVYVYVGARTGWLDWDFPSGNLDSYYVSPRAGISTLIGPAVAIYLQIYHSIQTEDVYSNDDDDMDDTDTGLYSGLTVFF